MHSPSSGGLAGGPAGGGKHTSRSCAIRPVTVTEKQTLDSASQEASRMQQEYTATTEGGKQRSAVLGASSSKSLCAVRHTCGHWWQRPSGQGAASELKVPGLRRRRAEELTPQGLRMKVRDQRVSWKRRSDPRGLTGLPHPEIVQLRRRHHGPPGRVRALPPRELGPLWPSQPDSWQPGYDPATSPTYTW